MTTDGPPTLADQVSRLYDLVGGYHVTHLMEIARELGVWEAMTGAPGVTCDDLAARLVTDSFYTDVLCRTAFSFGLLEREGPGWRMAPHFDQILGDPGRASTWRAPHGSTWCSARTTPTTSAASAPGRSGPTRSTARRSCARSRRR
jgi:hypothetical protein